MSVSTTHTSAQSESASFAYQQIINQITDLSWTTLNKEDLIRVAWAYYYASSRNRVGDF